MQDNYSMGMKPNLNDPMQRPRLHSIREKIGGENTLQLLVINENNSTTTFVLDTLMKQPEYNALEMEAKSKFQKAVIEAADKLFEAKPR